MSVATSTAIAIGGIAAAGGAVASGALQSGAAKSAAQTEATSAQNSLDFQKYVFEQQQQNNAPWLEAGKTALGELEAGTGNGGQFTEPYGQTFSYAPFNPGASFSAPTGVDESNDPGYAFRLSEGQKALERSEAAKGTGTGGAALKAAQRYGQDYASNEYSNVYNRALQQYQTNFGNALNAYQTNYGTSLGEFNTNYNVWSQNQANQFNRLASLAGVGQTAVGNINAAGTAAANNVAAINSSAANSIGNAITSAGSAQAAGALGVGNAFNGSVNSYLNYNALQQILNNTSQSGYANDNYVTPSASYR